MNMDKERSLLIVGTGAMACLFASRLSASGVDVTMLGSWEAGLAALRTIGVQIVREDGSEDTYPVRVISETRDCGRVDYALVLVKSWQTKQVANHLFQCLSANGMALTLQNGLGNREKLVEVLGTKRVSIGITTVGATLLGPGRVKSAGGDVISLVAHPRLSYLIDIFQNAGFVIENATDANALIWGKLIINAAINPITALLGIPNGELLERPFARKLLQETAREVATIAIKLGINLPYDDPIGAVETIARRTALNQSSMLQDIHRGAPTEIDAINGAVVQAGEQVGIDTPINETLFDLVKSIRP